MSELKITQEKVTAAFSEANDCPKAISILTALFGKQKPDYTDYHNIKTYEDACEAIGVKPIVRLLVEDEDGHKEEVADIAHLAYIKLCTIARALNNDPDFPRFSGKQPRLLGLCGRSARGELFRRIAREVLALVRCRGRESARCGARGGLQRRDARHCRRGLGKQLEAVL